MLGLVGIYGISGHHYILRAFNPYYAWRLLVDYPGWVFILGAVFLCTTGAEALYSDLGHCGRRNITISWIYVKAMLILNYLGQGAWIINNLGHIHVGANPFYTIMPSWLLIPGIVMATGAAIIASQALISGSFSIFSEAMNLNLWPRILIKYPARVKGQLYIPSVNMALFIGCVVTVLLFQSSSHMEAAYGLAITITMIITTVLLAVYMHQRKVTWWIVAVFAICFGLIEGSFLVANMFKFMNGGWYTLLIAGFIVAVMVTWYNAIRIRSKYILMRDLEPELDLIADIKRDDTVPRTASNLVFLSKSLIPGKVESKLLYSIINKGPKRADHYFLLRMEFADDPDTLEYSVDTLIKDTFYDITMRIGYRVSPRINVYLRDIVDDLVAAGEIDMISEYPSLKKRGIIGNFKFVIIRRVFSPSSVCGFWERFVMLRYELLRHLSTGYEKIFGLDTSIVDVERVPLIITNRSQRRIKREE
jgi:KUP system potassium uptake protein